MKYQIFKNQVWKKGKSIVLSAKIRQKMFMLRWDSEKMRKAYAFHLLGMKLELKLHSMS